MPLSAAGGRGGAAASAGCWRTLSSSLLASLCLRIPASTTLHRPTFSAPSFAAYSSLSPSFRHPARPLLHSTLSNPTCSLFPSTFSPFPLPHSLFFLPLRHATKKAGGSTKNSPGPPGKRLGLKTSGGTHVQPGSILVRQRGFEVHAGKGVGTGKDHTLFSTRSGRVVFTYLQRPQRTHGKRRKFINVLDVEGGETMEQLHAELAQLQADYLEVLRRKKLGIRIPTTRSVYLNGQAHAAREKAKQQLEDTIQRVTVQQRMADVPSPRAL